MEHHKIPITPVFQQNCEENVFAVKRIGLLSKQAFENSGARGIIHSDEKVALGAEKACRKCPKRTTAMATGSFVKLDTLGLLLVGFLRAL